MVAANKIKGIQGTRTRDLADSLALVLMSVEGMILNRTCVFEIARSARPATEIVMELLHVGVVETVAAVQQDQRIVTILMITEKVQEYVVSILGGIATRMNAMVTIRMYMCIYTAAAMDKWVTILCAKIGVTHIRTTGVTIFCLLTAKIASMDTFSMHKVMAVTVLIMLTAVYWCAAEVKAGIDIMVMKQLSAIVPWAVDVVMVIMP